jgi:pilus assembly protein Flp/PilA
MRTCIHVWSAIAVKWVGITAFLKGSRFRYLRRRGPLLLFSTIGQQGVGQGEKKMLKLVSQIRGAIKDDRGASAVEYALIVGLIAVVLISGVTLLGHNLGITFDKVATALPTP